MARSTSPPTQTPLDGTESRRRARRGRRWRPSAHRPGRFDGGTEYRDAVAAADSISCSASATLPGLTAGQESFGLFRTALPDDVLVSYLADTIIARRDAEAPGAAWNVAIVARADDYGLAVGNGLAASLAVPRPRPERRRLQPAPRPVHRRRRPK